MPEQEMKRIKAGKSLEREAQDDYLQFLSEWKTSALAMPIGLVTIGGIAFFLFEGRHMWQRFF